MRVVVAEAHVLLRDGLCRLLAATGFEVVEAVDTAELLGEAMLRHRPDVAVVDIRLPPTFTDEGLVAAMDARSQLPGQPVLVLSQDIEQRYLWELLDDDAGGVGLLFTDRVGNVAEFVSALRRVATGGLAMDPEMIGQLLRSGETPMFQLTPREHEVMELTAQGSSEAAIAARLFVPEKAIANHISSIFGKFDIFPSDDDNERVRAVLAHLQER
ncbi:MAG: response regulator transcription factor [Pseudonocardia sp.]|nr:response regulator transcription factor [Pseudonocardia sp.]